MTTSSLPMTSLSLTNNNTPEIKKSALPDYESLYKVELNFDTDIENIKREITKAKKTFQKYKWPSIDVTRKSVEETAASIIKIHEIYKNNVK